MTHEYVIALNGLVEPRAPERPTVTAVGWAADAVLAVGDDETVSAISRGDSTFLDLGGCVVTPLPVDIERADALVRATTDPGIDIGRLLGEAGLLGAESGLESGSPADLAFWGLGSDPDDPEGRVLLRLVASVKGGAFTEGDEHRGPFPAPTPRPEG